MFVFFVFYFLLQRLWQLSLSGALLWDSLNQTILCTFSGRNISVYFQSRPTRYNFFLATTGFFSHVSCFFLYIFCISKSNLHNFLNGVESLPFGILPLIFHEKKTLSVCLFERHNLVKNNKGVHGKERRAECEGEGGQPAK